MKWLDNLKAKATLAWNGVWATRPMRFISQKFLVIRNAVNAYRKSHDVQTVVASTIKSNLLYYAVPVITYEGILKPAFISNSPYEAYIDNTAQIFFGGLYLGMFVNNTLYNIALKKTLLPYVVPCKNHSCNCGGIDRAKSDLASSFYYTGNLLSASVLSAIPQGIAYFSGREMPMLFCYPGYILKALAYGFCIIGMKYSTHNACAMHTRKLVNNNIIYSYITGASFIYLTEKGAFILNQLAHRTSNVFIEDAVFSLLFQLYIMLSLLQENPLSVETTERDVFYYQRKKVDALLAKAADRIFTSLNKPVDKNYTRKVNDLLDTRATRWVANTKAISLFLDLHSTDIRTVLAVIVKAQGYPIWVVEYMPRFITPKAARAIANILQQQGWEDTEALVKRITKIATRARDRTETYTKNLAQLPIDVRFDESYVPSPSDNEVKTDNDYNVENLDDEYTSNKKDKTRELISLFVGGQLSVAEPDNNDDDEEDEYQVVKSPQGI